MVRHPWRERHWASGAGCAWCLDMSYREPRGMRDPVRKADPQPGAQMVGRGRDHDLREGLEVHRVERRGERIGVADARVAKGQAGGPVAGHGSLQPPAGRILAGVHVRRPRDPGRGGRDDEREAHVRASGALREDLHEGLGAGAVIGHDQDVGRSCMVSSARRRSGRRSQPRVCARAPGEPDRRSRRRTASRRWRHGRGRPPARSGSPRCSRRGYTRRSSR